MLCVSDERVHIADPHIPLLLITLGGIAPPLEELARRAGFRGALAKSEGIFALSQAIEELLQGKTFFLTASGTMPVNSHHDSKSATEEAKKKLKAIREPSTQDAASRR
jgi:DNA-binding NarL/FixJ family response regulator